jgi:hypothetical protein
VAKFYYAADLQFECLENHVTVGDAKFRLKVPYDGEILGARNGPRITGHIQDAGTGAGTYTEIQVRNVTTGRAYFSTTPRFQVDDKDANGRCILSGGVLSNEPTFRQNDVLALDVEGIPGGSDSAYATVWVTAGFWREV